MLESAVVLRFITRRFFSTNLFFFSIPFKAASVLLNLLLLRCSLNFVSADFASQRTRYSMGTVRVFFSGDVMLGRGIDQILPYHVDPILYEGYVTNAKVYVQLAESVNGPLPENISLDYIWGDALKVFDQMNPDIKVINLETSITDAGRPWPNKSIHYRMHPKNVASISSAGIDCCILSNNHVLDWGYEGFRSTLKALSDANINTVGAGLNDKEAEKPAIFDFSNTNKSCRVLIFGAGSPTAGVFNDWQATGKRMGINVIDETVVNLSGSVQKVKEMVNAYRQTNSSDIVIFSIHWGGNWGFGLERGQRELAHRLIDEVGIDVVYGHSSHHIKGVEIYKGKLIAYGCGDLLTDYEGIENEDYRGYRDDLSFMYFADFDSSTGDLKALNLAPMRLKNMQIRRAKGVDEQFLFDIMNRECRLLSGNKLIVERHDRHAGIFKLIF